MAITWTRSWRRRLQQCMPLLGLTLVLLASSIQAQDRSQQPDEPTEPPAAMTPANAPDALVTLAQPLEPFEAQDSCIPPQQCCKICSAGQACGDSCISRDKICHKGRGCACNAAEVCRADY
jgi:hypothetical protein